MWTPATKMFVSCGIKFRFWWNACFVLCWYLNSIVDLWHFGTADPYHGLTDSAAGAGAISPPRRSLAAISHCFIIHPVLKSVLLEKANLHYKPVLWIRIHRGGLLDPDPDPLFKDMDPDPSITKQKQYEKPWFLLLSDFFLTFYLWKWCKCTFKKY